MDELLQADLSATELRLALTLGRLLLGWKRRSAALGQRLLRETARMDGRTFARALTSLTEKGIVTVHGGGPGRGNRATYTLILQGQKPAQERAINPMEKPAPQRAKAKTVKARAQVPKKPAPARARIGSGKGSTPAPSADTLDTNQLRRDAFDAYLGTGATLLDRASGALARNVTSAAKAGTPAPLIIAACTALGKDRDFPGNLKHRITELQAQGGPCTWNGLNRSALTPQQLNECPCTKCQEWAQAPSAFLGSAVEAPKTPRARGLA